MALSYKWYKITLWKRIRINFRAIVFGDTDGYFNLYVKIFSLKFGIQSLLRLILVRRLARSLWASSVTLCSIRLYMKGNWLRGSNSFSQKHLLDRQYWRIQGSYIITIKCLRCFNKEESSPYLSWPRRGGDECLSQVRM